MAAPVPALKPPPPLSALCGDSVLDAIIWKQRQAHWPFDPVIFAEDVFGDFIYPEQAELIRTLAFSRRSAVVSGHKTGKGRAYGYVSWWDAILFPKTRVILTSASSGQVDAILWREVKDLYYRAVSDKRFNIATGQYDLPKQKHMLADKEPPNLAQTGIHLTNGSEIWGFTTDSPERIAGISGPRLRFRVDEASGYPDELYKALAGNCMGANAFISATSQGTRQTGWFYNAFHQPGSTWKTLELSCYNTPNAKAGREIVPGLATLEGIQAFIDDFGIDSGEFGIRVLGKFPKGSADAVITRGLIDEAVKRCEGAALDKDGKYIGDKAFLDAGTGPLVLGVDVARFGDDSTDVTPSRSDRGGTPVEKQGFDGFDVADLAAHVARELRRDREQVVIHIDVTGGLGVAPASRLREYKWPHGGPEFTVVEINYSEASNDPKCKLRRDDLWWKGRKVLQGNYMLPRHQKLRAELAEPTYRSPDGKVKVESKDEIKKRLHRSPDTADSWLQAVYEIDEEAIGKIEVIGAPTSFPEPRGLASGGPFQQWGSESFPRWG